MSDKPIMRDPMDSEEAKAMDRDNSQVCVCVKKVLLVGEIILTTSKRRRVL